MRNRLHIHTYLPSYPPDRCILYDQPVPGRHSNTVLRDQET